MISTRYFFKWCSKSQKQGRLQLIFPLTRLTPRDFPSFPPQVYIIFSHKNLRFTQISRPFPHLFPMIFPHFPMGQGTQLPASLVALQTTSWADSNTPLGPDVGNSWGIFRDFNGIQWICCGILWILWWILWSKHKCQWVSERENSQEDISNNRKLRSHASMIDGFTKDTILQKTNALLRLPVHLHFDGQVQPLQFQGDSEHLMYAITLSQRNLLGHKRMFETTKQG